MPPPPVAGAAVGIACAVCVRLADGRALALRVADGRGLALGVADRLGLGVLCGLVGLPVGDAEAVAPGDSFGSVVCGDEVHPTTAPDANTAAMPTAMSLALNTVAAVGVRTFLDS